MSKIDKTHDLYCEKLKKIGEKLRFQTSWEDSKEKELYHLANPDCIWYREMPDVLKGNKFPGVPDKIPLVVFEVLYSEQPKSMRGSLGSFLIRGAYLGVFVVIKKSNESDAKYKQRIDYLNKMIENLGFGKFAIWQQSTVDELEQLVNALK